METPLARWARREARMSAGRRHESTPTLPRGMLPNWRPLMGHERTAVTTFNTFLSHRMQILVLVTLRLGFSTQRLTVGPSFEALITRS